jgi:hypothetical protein
VWLARVPLIDYFAAHRVESFLAGVRHYRFREVYVDIQVLIIIIIVLGGNIAHTSLSHIGYLRVYGNRFGEKATSSHQIVIWVIGHLSDLRYRRIFLCLWWLSHSSVMAWIPYRVPHGDDEGVSKINLLNGVRP